MKNLIINSFIFKNDKFERKNFNIKSDYTDEINLSPIIISGLNIDQDKWELEKNKFEFLPKESVVIYKAHFKEK